MSQKRIRIKDIARMAGVSSGTVDRVIHNRGKVSPKALEKIEGVLKEVNYRPNIHISSISLKKKYKVLFISPNFKAGDYWESIYQGIVRALNEFETIEIRCEELSYDQYDIYHCRKVYHDALKQKMDAVIIGSIFQNETQTFCHQLDEKEIPYVFVDSNVEDTSPVACFSSDHFTCGYLMSKIMNAIMHDNRDIGILQAMRVGNESANSTILRKNGFNAYLNERGLERKIHRIPFTATELEKNDDMFDAFFSKNNGIGGIVVLNSRGHIIADYLSSRNIKDIKLIGIDLTTPNILALKEGNIDSLIGQNPKSQGFLAMRSLIEHLIFKLPIKVENIMPLDIVTKETIDFYSEFKDLVYLNQYV